MTNRMTRQAAAWFELGLLAATLSVAGLFSPGPAQAASVSVAVENYDFAPASRTITAGDVVRWTFSGDQHSVTSRDGLFNSGIKDPGASFQFTFTKAGTYRYYCVVHPDLDVGHDRGQGQLRDTRAHRPADPEARATPRPTARATAQPTASPTPTPRPTPADAGPSGSPAPSASVSPAASADASLALVETPGASGPTASPAPAPTEPAAANDPTPILAGLALLAVIVVARRPVLARRRRST